jgi:hypothetical protein
MHETTSDSSEEATVGPWCIRIGTNSYIGWEESPKTGNHPATEIQGYFYAADNPHGHHHLNIDAEVAASRLFVAHRDLLATKKVSAGTNRMESVSHPGSWKQRVSPSTFIGWQSGAHGEEYFYAQEVSPEGDLSGRRVRSADQAMECLANALNQAQEEVESVHMHLDGRDIARGSDANPLSLVGRLNHLVGNAEFTAGRAEADKLGVPVLSLCITEEERKALVTDLWELVSDEMAQRSDIGAIRGMLDRIEYMSSKRPINGMHTRVIPMEGNRIPDLNGVYPRPPSARVDASHRDTTATHKDTTGLETLTEATPDAAVDFDGPSGRYQREDGGQ